MLHSPRAAPMFRVLRPRFRSFVDAKLLNRFRFTIQAHMARLSYCLRLNKTRRFRFTIQAHQERRRRGGNSEGSPGVKRRDPCQKDVRRWRDHVPTPAERAEMTLYTTVPCHHCIRFCGCNALLLAAHQRYTKASCTVRLLTCVHVVWGGLPALCCLSA